MPWFIALYFIFPTILIGLYAVGRLRRWRKQVKAYRGARAFSPRKPFDPVDAFAFFCFFLFWPIILAVFAYDGGTQ